MAKTVSVKGMETFSHCLLVAAEAGRDVRASEEVTAAAVAVAVDWARKVRRSSWVMWSATVVCVGEGARKAWLVVRVARSAVMTSFMVVCLFDYSRRWWVD